MSNQRNKTIQEQRMEFAVDKYFQKIKDHFNSPAELEQRRSEVMDSLLDQPEIFTNYMDAVKEAAIVKHDLLPKREIDELIGNGAYSDGDKVKIESMLLAAEKQVIKDGGSKDSVAALYELEGKIDRAIETSNKLEKARLDLDTKYGFLDRDIIVPQEATLIYGYAQQAAAIGGVEAALETFAPKKAPAPQKLANTPMSPKEYAATSMPPADNNPNRPTGITDNGFSPTPAGASMLSVDKLR